MWIKVLFLTGSLLAAVIYLMLPKEHCVCGVKVPEFGGMASQQMLRKCGEYNGRIVIKEQSSGKDKLRERELKRIEEEKRKGDSYDTTL